ncbi:MAG: tRNA (N6-isopentenyl adenosine(37)-C2)-methylthiotransferase MiaB [Schwartzia sp.]|nr:tRNA (N6-isopentenyl adenosine(37)-C2)-methylthiotransferase MiaB [Schwartzia sp. (in: firmicutes)]
MTQETRLVKFLVYGCQMNFAEAERMAGQLREIGFESTEDAERADLVLMHTCCVRETAEGKAYGKIGEIKRLKREKPSLLFGVTGCMAQKESDALIRRAPHIDFVLGTGRLGEIRRVVEELLLDRVPHFVDVSEGGALPEKVTPARQGTVSAWVPIMYGCDNFCTYCIVPYVRGRERSRRPEDILAEMRDAAARGVREVTLLGQNVNSYGKDHKLADFVDLLREADKVEGIERVRFMTSHPKDLSERLVEAVRYGKHLCEHFHLPVQHGSDSILKVMNRNYTTEKYRELAQAIRREVPGASLTTDLIVGFPGETDADVEALLDFLREIRYDAAYTFLYSPRSGTPAAKMDGQVPDEVKHERLERLMALQNEISLEINERLSGTVQEVLVEGPSRTDETIWTGRTRTGKIVLWPHQGETAGELARVKITQPQTWVLKGERLG